MTPSMSTVKLFDLELKVATVMAHIVPVEEVRLICDNIQGILLFSVTSKLGYFEDMISYKAITNH